MNYDKNNWDNLKKVLETDHTKIDARSRAQVLDDAFVLALSGHLEHDVPLNLLKAYFLKEREYDPLAALVR